MSRDDLNNHSLKVKVIPNEQGINYQWLDGQTAELQQGDAQALLAAHGSVKGLSLIVPAQYAVLRSYAFDAGEAKLLRQTMPYSLEDELLSDVDELHFALGEPQDNQVSVAIIESAHLQSWLDDLKTASADSDFEITSVIPELMLLPWIEGQWTLCVQPQDQGLQYLLRASASQGFALQGELFAKALSLLIAEQGLPQSMMLYCDEALREEVKAELPDDLQTLLLWQSGNYWSLLTDDSQPGERINFLQAGFALSLPWGKWWQQWKGAAAVLALLAGVQIAYAYGHNYQLENKNLELRRAIEQAYRTAVPRGAIVDPEKQLRRKVSSMQGGSGDGFVKLLSTIANATQSVSGFEIQNLNYTEKQNEVRLTVLANSFNDVEKVRSQLQRQGLQAELTGSSSEAGKTRARLRIRG